MLFTFFCKKDQLLQNVQPFVEKVFKIEQESVKKQLVPILNILRKDIVCFVEYPYVDKFYRDTYYNFFSKKHNSYNRNSIRISFFQEDLDIFNYYKLPNGEIEKLFLGFISLRPTTYKIIGHSFLSPKSLSTNQFVCCLCPKVVLVNGKKLSINGFPFCNQDNESISCAESVIINLFDYFGNKYERYSTILPSQVTKILSKQSFERQLPTSGMPMENISYVLKKLGFGAVIYSHDKKIYNQEEFKEIIYTYIESGIPLIALLSDDKINHAVIIIGREDINGHRKYVRHKYSYCHDNKSFVFSSTFKNLLVMNDNHVPYEMVKFGHPIVTNKKMKLRSIVVPLYSKVFLDAYQFKRYFSLIINEFAQNESTKHIHFYNNNNNNIVRFYLTSSRSYKDYFANAQKVSDDFKSLIINKAMPKFVWVGEIISGSELSVEQNVKSIIVIDATESGLDGHLIFATNSRYLIIRNHYWLEPLDPLDQTEENPKKYRIFDFGNEIFYTFVGNLKGNHTEWESH